MQQPSRVTYGASCWQCLSGQHVCVYGVLLQHVPPRYLLGNHLPPDSNHPYHALSMSNSPTPATCPCLHLSSSFLRAIINTPPAFYPLPHTHTHTLRCAAGCIPPECPPLPVWCHPPRAAAVGASHMLCTPEGAQLTGGSSGSDSSSRGWSGGRRQRHGGLVQCAVDSSRQGEGSRSSG